nr:sigma-70 family RNA polymerase sigma factor [uncultured Flavobacterium sp.]
MNKNEIFKSWISDYSKPLLQRATYLLSNQEDAEDLVQEVFIAAFNSFENFKEDSQPKTWLMAILKNKIADYYRSKYKTDPNISLDHFFNEAGHWKSMEVISDWNASEGETSLLDDSSFTKTLGFCMEQLPEKWRILVKLYYLDEKKAPEVSQELNISTNNLWKILQRSRMQLRSCLENKWFAVN